MDTEFEAEMLRLVDDFLASDGGTYQFRHLQETLGPYYFEKSHSVTAPIEERYPLPLDMYGQISLEVYRKWEGYAESDRVYQEQMLQDRRWFFVRVLEEATFTTPYDSNPEERREIGLLQLSEYVALVRKEREEYRQAFGR